MTTKEFKIWMLQNNYDQKAVADCFGLTDVTVSRYCTANKFPRWFKFALRGLER